jgi:hypothetical protein
MTYKGKPPKVPSNALSEATSRGYPFLDLEGGKEIEGVWYSAFTRDLDRTGPRLFVGLRDGEWDFVFETE